MKRIFISLSLLVLSVISTYAQSDNSTFSETLSPYTMYGLGSLSDQSNSASLGMNGVGIAFRDGNRINPLNPASYSSVDSLSFIFDISGSMQTTRFNENGNRSIVGTGSFDHIIAGFRAVKNVGVAFGMIPYSEIGYNFSSQTPVKNQQGGGFYPEDETFSLTQTSTYTGEGGIQQIFIGSGWQPVKGLSIGFNAAYMWGKVNRDVTCTYSDSDVKSLYKLYKNNVHSYKLTFGTQYTYELNNKDNVTLGATYTPGHKFTGETELYYISANIGSGVIDTTKYVAPGGRHLPTELAVGLAFKHSDKWQIGLDYSLQKWSSIESSNYENGGVKMPESTGSYNDRHKFNIGGEWCRNPLGRRFLDKVRCRAGFSYTSPYLKLNTINGVADGPREIAASIGFGLPIINAYNNRSMINIGLKWVNEAGSAINTNALILNIGIKFNERWFAKWRFE